MSRIKKPLIERNLWRWEAMRKHTLRVFFINYLKKYRRVVTICTSFFYCYYRIYVDHTRVFLPLFFSVCLVDVKNYSLGVSFSWEIISKQMENLSRISFYPPKVIEFLYCNGSESMLFRAWCDKQITIHSCIDLEYFFNSLMVEISGSETEATCNNKL